MKARIDLMHVNPGVIHAMLGLERQVQKTEALTLVADTHVSDEVYERVREQFPEDELVHLTLAIVSINGWNRLNVAARTVPGDYVPGSLASLHAAADRAQDTP
jgi:hypothetical protein